MQSICLVSGVICGLAVSPIGNKGLIRFFSTCLKENYSEVCAENRKNTSKVFLHLRSPHKQGEVPKLTLMHSNRAVENESGPVASLSKMQEELSG